MEQTKIFVNRLLKDDLRRNLNRSFEVAKKAVLLLSKNAFPITKDNVLDAIQMTKKSSEGNPVENQIYIGSNPDNRVLLYECLYSFDNCSHLDDEFQKMLDKSLKSINIPVMRQEMEARAKEEYDRMRNEIYTLFHPSIGTEVDTKNLQKWIEVVNCEISLPDNLEDLLEEAATIYCESEKAETAFELNKKAAKAIEDFVSCFRKEIHPSDVGVLFIIDNGRVYPVEINYNKLL